jgi:hypothetical protein
MEQGKISELMGLFEWEATTISGLESKKNIEFEKEQE